MEFEKLTKNNFPTHRPIPEKHGRVRGNKNIFKIGLSYYFIKLISLCILFGSAFTSSMMSYCLSHIQSHSHMLVLVILFNCQYFSQNFGDSIINKDFPSQ